MGVSHGDCGVRTESVLQRKHQGHSTVVPGPEKERMAGCGWQHSCVSRCAIQGEGMGQRPCVSTSLGLMLDSSTPCRKGREPQRCPQWAWRRCGGSGGWPRSKRQCWHREEWGDWHMGR